MTEVVVKEHGEKGFEVTFVGLGSIAIPTELEERCARALEARMRTAVFHLRLERTAEKVLLATLPTAALHFIMEIMRRFPGGLPDQVSIEGSGPSVFLTCPALQLVDGRLVLQDTAPPAVSS